MTADPLAPDAAMLEITESPLAAAPADWDELVGPGGADFYSSRAWHLAMAGLNGAEERLVVARGRDGALRAVVPVFHFASGPANPLLHPGTLFGCANATVDPAARQWEPVTVVGNASGYSTAPATSDDLSSWAVAASRVAAEGTAVVPYLTGDVVSRLRDLWPDKPMVLTSLRVVVPVPGTSIDEYYAAIPRRRRELVRRERRLLTDGERAITMEEMTDANITDLARLQENTQRRHGSFGDAGYFERLYQRMSSALRGVVFALVCRHEGRALGFLWAVVHGKTLVARSIGLDYERVGRYAEYFNLMIHEPVRYCLAHGLGEIDMSVGSYQQKLLRGGRPVLAWSVLLRPPPQWTAHDTELHNRKRARQLLAEAGRLAPAEIADQLRCVAASGRAQLS